MTWRVLPLWVVAIWLFGCSDEAPAAKGDDAGGVGGSGAAVGGSTTGGKASAGQSNGGMSPGAVAGQGGSSLPPDPNGPRAFPGAEGFGTQTPGGRGGKVFVVTTLEGRPLLVDSGDTALDDAFPDVVRVWAGYKEELLYPVGK
jgi:hypothetical protein